MPSPSGYSSRRFNYFPRKCVLASELLEVSTFALVIDCVWSLRLSVMDSGGSHWAVPIALPLGHHGLHQLADLGRCIQQLFHVRFVRIESLA